MLADRVNIRCAESFTAMHEAKSVVDAWMAAANGQAVERLLELSDPAIELVGPRGSAHGHDVLRAWIARAGVTLTPQRTFASGDTVVVAQRGVWRSPETGETSEADVASVFRVRDGRVTYLARYDDLQTALAQAGIEAPADADR